MSEHRLLRMFRRVVLPVTIGLVATSGCSQAHPEGSTETGNPPVIEPSLVALLVSTDEVHVIGEPGAVTPGGIEVEVRTIGSGDVASGPVAEDGSFDVPVDAAPEDAFELRAVDGTESSPAVYLVRGGAAVGEGDGGGLTCDQRIDLAAGQIDQAVEAADASCSADADCTSVSLALACHAACGDAVVSQTGEAELRAVLDGLEKGLCDGFQADGCQVLQPPCPQGPPTDWLACVAGQCEIAGPTPGCDTCLDVEVSWGAVGFFGGPGPDVDASRYTVTGCGDFELRSYGGLSCTTSLTQCDGDAVTLQDLMRALADPDVVAALASGEYVYKEPGPDEPYFELRVGAQTLNFGPDCVDGVPCNEPSTSVAGLRTMLDEIAQQQACRPDDCLLPFDAGTGSDGLGVFSFDPRAGTCVARVYNGSGGNANRFDSFLECAQACPVLREDPGCPPSYAYVEDACVSPGLAGGCAQTTPACVVGCSDQVACGPEALATTCSGRGLCEVYSPF